MHGGRHTLRRFSLEIIPALSTMLLAMIITGMSQSKAQESGRPDVVLTAEGEAVHFSGMLFDGHNDLPWEIRDKGNSSFDILDISKDQPTLHTDIARLKKGGLKAQFTVVSRYLGE